MIKKEIAGHQVEIYDSIDELPIKRFHKYNKFLLVDAGVGSDLNDVNLKINTIIKHVKNKSEFAVTELENLRQSLFLISSELSPKHLAFSALVHSIDGSIIHDLSDESLYRVLDKLKNVKQSWLSGFLESNQKKKSTKS